MTINSQKHAVEKLKETSGHTLISKYTGVYKPITYICAKCGKESTETFHNAKRRRGCKHCIGVSKIPTQKEAEKTLFKKQGHILLSKYKGNKGKVTFKCGKCGNISKDEKTYHIACRVQGCSNCRPITYTQKQAETILFKFRGHVLLSPYLGTDKKIDYRCGRCGKISINNSTFNNAKNQVGCKHCRYLR